MYAPCLSREVVGGMGPGVGVGTTGTGPRDVGQHKMASLDAAATTVALSGLNQHTPLKKTLAPQASAPAAAQSAQHASGVAAGGCGIARHSGVPGQMSRLGTNWQVDDGVAVPAALSSAR